MNVGRARDGLLDLLRAVSIVRVVFIHVLNRAELWFWPAPTYVMPGMPFVFFVSGGLAYQSLRLRDGVRRSARVYWRKTYRRLLLPYWTFYALIATVAVVGDLLSDSDRWSVRWHSLVLGATGLIVPKPSPAVSAYIGHLWFMSVFLVMAFLTPGLVRWFERSRWAMYATVVGLFVVVQWLDLTGTVEVPRELDRLSLFAVLYCVGFLYTDGLLVKAPAQVLAMVSGGAAIAAWIYNDVEPGAVNAHDPKHLFVGLAWLFAFLALAPVLRRFATRWERPIEMVNRRSFTAFLWGWPTCALAAELAEELADGVWAFRGLMAVMSVVLLAIAVVTFGFMEDRAAGLAPARSLANAPELRSDARPSRGSARSTDARRGERRGVMDRS